MTEHTFSNWMDFGMFAKVNIDNIREALPELDISLLDDAFKTYIGAKGGCGCTKKKRNAVANAAYVTAATFISENPEVAECIKRLVGNAEKIRFQNPDSPKCELPNQEEEALEPFVIV